MVRPFAYNSALTRAGFHRSTEPKGKVEPGVTLIERFSHSMFLKSREDLIQNIHRKTATAAKRIKTEEIDMVAPSLSAVSNGQESVDDIHLTVSSMQESISRLEMQARVGFFLFFFLHAY